MKSIIIISDTHTKHKDIIFRHRANIIIFAGDSVNTLNCKNKKISLKEISCFVVWMGSLDIKHKIFVSGNGDGVYISKHEDKIRKLCTKNGIIYLRDEATIIDGVKIYGSPWTIKHNVNDGYALKTEKKLLKKYKRIDKDTDILITHTPPKYILDKGDNEGDNFGSTSLRKVVLKMDNLKYHVFGHIHESQGVMSINQTTFINAAYSSKLQYQLIKYY